MGETVRCQNSQALKCKHEPNSANSQTLIWTQHRQQQVDWKANGGTGRVYLEGGQVECARISTVSHHQHFLT